MDIGNKGETIFVGWCHDVNLVPNKSIIDKHGWDYIVDLPQSFKADLKSLDKDDSLDQIFVQVKTTKSEQSNRSIKLSNLKRLINSPLPSFYILIQISVKGEPVKAHLFHVWDKIIEQVQRKLRLTKKDQWDTLHKIKLTLPWSEAQEFKEFHGNELIKLFKQNVETGQNEYALQKHKLKNKSGYENETGRIEFKGKVPKKYKDDPDSFFVDLFLGEIDQVDLIEYSEIDIRFGDEVITNKGEGGNFKLLNIEPEGDALINFHTIDHRISVEFKAEYFIPRGIGKLVDEEKLKILYKAPYIKFSLFPFSKRITYNFNIPDFRKETQFSKLMDIARIMLFLNEIEDKESVIFEIDNQDNPFMGGNLSFSKYTEKQPLEYFKAIKAAGVLLNYLDIDPEIIINPRYLHRQLGLLDYFQKLLAPKPLHMKMEFSLLADLDNYKKTVALLPFTIGIGDYIIPLQVSVHGKPEKTGDIIDDEFMYRMQSNDIRIEQYRKLKKGKESSKEAHKEMKEISLEKYDVSEDVMVVHYDDEDDVKRE